MKKTFRDQKKQKYFVWEFSFLRLDLHFFVEKKTSVNVFDVFSRFELRRLRRLIDFFRRTLKKNL